jgi:maltose 6'-phosphate phosphatase
MKKWFHLLDSNDETLKRLELIQLLREGKSPQEVAEKFYTSVEYLYRLNAVFSQSGVPGILAGVELRMWLDFLNRDDPIVRRLEMIRLKRAGTPLEVIAKEYNTTVEYINRLESRFSEHGSIGILKEQDFHKFRSIYPAHIRVCSFNLKGTDKNDPPRLHQIARELSEYSPDLCAFQEVISGGGIEETSGQIAERLTKITGDYYRTYFVNCHLYHDKYPEGVAVSSRHAFKNTLSIDLNHGLRGGLKSVMDRYASVAEVEAFGKKIIFASVHLDHDESPDMKNSQLRYAQVEKLYNTIEKNYGDSDLYCTIVAGDLNDIEDSDALTFLKEKGFVDSYRSLHHEGGNTYDSANPSTRIDYIMVKGNVKIHSAQLILQNPEWSDHIGLLAVIE